MAGSSREGTGPMAHTSVRSRRGWRKLTVLLMTVTTLMAVLPGHADADFTKTKVAVLDFELQGEGFETKDMGAIVSEWFITALVKVGRFDVIERRLLKKILEEQKLGMSGVLDEATATQIGKLLGVKVIISGSVMKLQHVLEINARIIDVETASIIAAESVKSSTAAHLKDLVVQMSEKIIKNFPLEGYIVNTNGKKVAIDLGRVAGVKTGMEFLVFKEGNVIKHPKTGEVLDVERIQTGKLKITRVRDKIANADIIQESSPGAIAYGQLVQSLAGPLTPLKKEPVVVRSDPPKKEAPAARKPARADTRRSRETDDIIRKLRSTQPRDIVWAAKRIVKSYPQDQNLLDVAQEALISGYRQRVNDRHYVDAMAWLCNALGRSRISGYKPTLEQVSKEAANRKLKAYAEKNLRYLR